MQIAVLAGIAVLMTIGVYGLVAGIVKLDDAGLYLSQRPARLARACGRGILAAAPTLMKGLSVAGTAAMFLVGGGILMHGLPGAHHAVAAVKHAVGVGGLLGTLTPLLLDGLAGIAAGALVLAAVSLGKRLFR